MSGEGGQNLSSALGALAKALDRLADAETGASQLNNTTRMQTEYVGLIAGYLATLAGTFPSSIVAPQNGGTGVANAPGETITLGGAVATAGALTLSGAFALTFTLSNTTGLTLPTTGTLSTLAGSETLSNKTLTTPNIGAATGASVALTSTVAANNATATPAGGTAGTGFSLGSVGLRWIWGSGAPSASVPKGSLYSRTDGSTTNDRMYVATDAVGGWAAVITAS